MATRLVDRLRSARQVLAGVDATGARIHPGMFDPQVISLAHGDGTRRPHPSVVAAGLAALLETEQASLDDYLFLQRHEEFEAAVTADFLAGSIPAEYAANVCIDSGTTRLFASFLHACSEPGDVFLVPRSYYHPLPGWCELHRVELELVPTEPGDDYRLTAAALDAWYARNPGCRPRGLFLFNPTQTGALYEPGELAAIAEVAGRRGLLVLEDCVFAGTEFPGQPPVRHLAAAAPEFAGNVVTLKGASKAFNLANIRIGWGCGPAPLVQRMNEYTVATAATVPYLAKAMALAALRVPADYGGRNATECARRAQLIAELVAECNSATDLPLLEVSHHPQAGHAVAIAAPGLVGLRSPDGSVIDNSIAVSRFLLTEARVAASPGYSLGFDGTELRLAFGSVGVKRTYPGAARGEFGAVLSLLAGNCRGSSPAAARHLDEASRQLGAVGPSTDGDDFSPGRELIGQAFRDRILPALQRLVGSPQRLSYAGVPGGRR